MTTPIPEVGRAVRARRCWEGGKTPVGLDMLDRRIKANQVFRDLHRELTELCGGSPTAEQRRIIDRWCGLEIRAAQLDHQRLMQGEESERALDAAIRISGTIVRLREALDETIRRRKTSGTEAASLTDYAKPRDAA